MKYLQLNSDRFHREREKRERERERERENLTLYGYILSYNYFFVMRKILLNHIDIDTENLQNVTHLMRSFVLSL